MHCRHRSSSLYQTDEHSNWRKRRLRLPPNWRELIRRKACWSDKKFNFVYVILASQMKMSFNKLFISYPFRRYIWWNERIRKRFRKTHQICLLSIFLRLESLSLGTSAAKKSSPVLAIDAASLLIASTCSSVGSESTAISLCAYLAIKLA